jgi:prepilin-type N-terminal cleavage/methylation domain-containing protein
MKATPSRTATLDETKDPPVSGDGFFASSFAEASEDRPLRLARCRGFTLLELLVAVSITVLLVGLILAVTTGVLNLWRRMQGGFGAGAEAKLALDLLERDLQAALYRTDGNTWLAVDVTNNAAGLGNRGWLTSGPTKPATAESLRLLPEPDAGGVRHLSEARFGLSGTWLRFIASTAESSSEPGLPRAIAYQICRRPVTGPVNQTNPAALRYTLFRAAVAADSTFAAGYNLLTGNYASTSGSPSATRNPATITNPNNADALASNVIDFGVWLQVRQADGSLRQIFPATAGDLSHAARSGGDEVPQVADVMLRILSEEGATLIENIERGRLTRPPQHATDAEWWWAVAEANSRVYTRRIEIKGGAL